MTDHLLAREHGIENVSAAYLLVFGRRAIHAYAAAHGQNLALLVPLLADAVGAWIDINGGSRQVVSAAASTIDALMLAHDYAIDTGRLRPLDS